MPEEDTRSDLEVIADFHAGMTADFSVLWERHYSAALVAARRMSSKLDADDVVSEAFLKVFEILKRGGGPHGAFRPYLYRVIRSVVSDRVQLPEDPSETLEVFAASTKGSPWEDETFDAVTAGAAFASLQPRWQTVLWHSEVEGLPPRKIGPLMGISANSVSALLSRARDGLRSAWVEAHIERRGAPPECSQALQDLQRFKRNLLTAARSRTVEAHLKTCDKCDRASREIEYLNRRLTLVLITIVLGGGVPASAILGPASAAPAQALLPQDVDPPRWNFDGMKSNIVVPAVTVATVVGALAAAAFFSLGASTSQVASDPDSPLSGERDTSAGLDSKDESENESDEMPGGAVEGPLGSPDQPLDLPTNLYGPTATHPADTSNGAVYGPIDSGALDDRMPADGDATARDSTDTPVAEERPQSDAGDEEATDSDTSEPPDASDPSLGIGRSCFTDHGDGYRLIGMATHPGAIRGRITPEGSATGVDLNEYLVVTGTEGNNYENVLTVTTPDPYPWWRTPSLTPLSKWKGLQGYDISEVTIELRLLTADGRYSAWTTVSPQPCLPSRSLQSDGGDENLRTDDSV
ncbi:sigma-70 family RNA polymerase sigma factor [Leucobacter tardus]|uniref:Sigma-70 family RNA polymerase sigma factor n=1 Tax=Leucobacter tardus TaxID=501483 RepID=A0A939QAY0_9MICO|nr:sigma-70 family RNA polymerase sigma factor [Leucobacter tardus]